MCDYLIVYTNSDDWLSRKKGKPFMSQETRSKILECMRPVDLVVSMTADNDYDGSANWAIANTRMLFPDAEIFFMNGGDRITDNIPEHQAAKDNNVQLVFGVGGTTKEQSSSEILINWRDK